MIKLEHSIVINCTLDQLFNWFINLDKNFIKWNTNHKKFVKVTGGMEVGDKVYSIETNGIIPKLIDYGRSYSGHVSHEYVLEDVCYALSIIQRWMTNEKLGHMILPSSGSTHLSIDSFIDKLISVFSS
jgi:hypothetical protein